MERANEHAESVNQSNDGYTTAGVIQLRLDTGPLLDSLEAYFKGSRIIGYVDDSQGTVKPKFGTVGKPKMNDEGSQSLMSWLTPLFSPHTVQGNFQDREELNTFLARLETDFYCHLILNRTEWDISITEIDGIADMVMDTMEVFLTRTLNNKERESYSNTIRSIESSRSERAGGGLLGLGS